MVCPSPSDSPLPPLLQACPAGSGKRGLAATCPDTPGGEVVRCLGRLIPRTVRKTSPPGPLSVNGEGETHSVGVRCLGVTPTEEGGYPPPGGWYNPPRRKRLYQSEANVIPTLYQNCTNFAPALPLQGFRSARERRQAPNEKPHLVGGAFRRNGAGLAGIRSRSSPAGRS